MLADLRHRRAAQGASTSTQQLARQSFLTADKTIHRKLQELVLAARIERRYTKQQILELYLNKVYFGDGLYGVETASRGYFGKTAAEVSLAEAALLAGLVKSPSTSAPTVNLERAQSRRNVVLQVMLDSGVIKRDAWQAARNERVVLRMVEMTGFGAAEIRFVCRLCTYCIRPSISRWSWACVRSICDSSSRIRFNSAGELALRLKRMAVLSSITSRWCFA